MSFLTRIRGERGAAPRRATLSAALLAGFGGFLSTGALAWLAMASGYPLVIGSFGASVVLLLCLPEAPVAQPRNLVGGHFISSLTGLACLHLCGPCWQGMALAAGPAVVLMMLTGTVHPPGKREHNHRLHREAGLEFSPHPRWPGPSSSLPAPSFTTTLPAASYTRGIGDGVRFSPPACL